MTEYLNAEDVIAIHDRHAGMSGIRDAGLIESAVARPQATVFGEDAYPTVWEKAAALLHSVAGNHAFVDGNKRTAWLCARVFLALNGHQPDPETDEDAAVAFVVAVAEGRYEDVASIASELVKFFT